MKKNKRVKLQKNRVLLLLCIILGISVVLLTMTIFMDTSGSTPRADDTYHISSVTIEPNTDEDKRQKELTPVPAEVASTKGNGVTVSPVPQKSGAAQVLRSENGEVVVDTRYAPLYTAMDSPSRSPNADSPFISGRVTDEEAFYGTNDASAESNGAHSFDAVPTESGAYTMHSSKSDASAAPFSRAKGQDDALLHNVTPPATSFEANIGVGTADGALLQTKDAGKKEAKLVFVIDDAGHNLTQLEPFLQLPFPVTIAVLPSLDYSLKAAELARRAGKDVLLHQPMQAKDLSINPGPAAVTPTMSANEITSLIKKNIASLGGVSGVNNHEGSLITENAVQLGAVLDACKEANVFFLDSRTTSQSVARKVASSRSMRIWERSVFLDNSNKKEDIVAAVRLGMDIATKNGVAIMIGHARSDNLAAILLELYPEMLLQGYKITVISDL